MDADNYPLLSLLAGVFAGAMVSGLTGFAFSAVAGAVLLHVLPPAEAVPLMMACSVLVQVACLASLRQQIAWRESLPFIAGGLAGLPPALYLLLTIEPTLFRICFGVFLACYAGYMLFRPAPRPSAHPADRWRCVAVGFASGIVGGVTAMPGALLVVWCDLRGLGKEAQRALTQPFIATMQVAALALLALRGALPEGLTGNVLVSLGPLLAGTLAGLALFGRVNDGLFRRLLLSVLLASGLAYVLGGTD